MKIMFWYRNKNIVKLIRVPLFLTLLSDTNIILLQFHYYELVQLI